MTLNINLTPQLEKLVRQKVDSGRYNSASEVVREALRLMERQNELHTLQLERLRRDIHEGLDSGPARPWSVKEMKRPRPQAPRSSQSRRIDALRCFSTAFHRKIPRSCDEQP